MMIVMSNIFYVRFDYFTFRTSIGYPCYSDFHPKTGCNQMIVNKVVSGDQFINISHYKNRSSLSGRKFTKSRQGYA